MRSIGFTILLVLVAAAAWGAFGDVISSFAGPGATPLALAWDGQYLWCTTQTPDCTFRLNPANGSVISSYVTGFGYSARGLTWANSSIYDGNDTPNYINRRNTSGSIMSSFGTTAFYGGLAYDGTNLWATSTSPHTFWEYTTAGSLVDSFSVTFYPFDPGCDGTYLYCGTYQPAHSIYKLTTTGSIVTSAAAPSDFPWGCCYDGTNLWISTTSGTNAIWKLDAGNTGIAPASLGKVKAVYR
jgi:hypothetical protein